MLSLKQVANAARERAEKDKDLAIVVTGAEGDGKSALAIGLAMEIDPLFEFERNMLFSPEVKLIKEKIYNLPPFSAIIADEAIKVLYKLNWQSKVQKYLNTIYTLCRNQNKISIFNIPRLIDANEYFRNHRLKIWIHIVDPINNQKTEGHACIMSRSWNPVSKDPWGLDYFEKKINDERRRGMKDSHYSLDQKIGLFSELPSFIEVIRFEWIQSKLWREYELLKDKYSIKDDDVMEDDKALLQIEAFRKMVVKSVNTFMAMGYSKASIARLFSVHVNSVNGWINKYVVEEELKKINEPH